MLGECSLLSLTKKVAFPILPPPARFRLSRFDCTSTAVTLYCYSNSLDVDVRLQQTAQQGWFLFCLLSLSSGCLFFFFFSQQIRSVESSCPDASLSVSGDDDFCALGGTRSQLHDFCALGGTRSQLPSPPCPAVTGRTHKPVSPVTSRVMAKFTGFFFVCACFAAMPSTLTVGATGIPPPPWAWQRQRGLCTFLIPMR